MDKPINSEGFEAMPRLKTILFSFTLTILLSACDLLRAELFLGVDFDINQAGVQSNAIVDTNGKTTAYIVLYLTDASDLYFYEFSVRYNSDRLTLDSVNDLPPIVRGGDLKFILPTLELQTVTGTGKGFVNYTEINRFDGKIDDPSDTLAITAADTVGGLVLGTLTFTVSGGGDGLLIMPGLFEPETNIVLPYDVFLGNNLSNVTFQSGTIVSVPEPTSLLLVLVSSLIWTTHRRYSGRKKLLQLDG